MWRKAVNFAYNRNSLVSSKCSPSRLAALTPPPPHSHPRSDLYKFHLSHVFSCFQSQTRREVFSSHIDFHSQTQCQLPNPVTGATNSTLIAQPVYASTVLSRLPAYSLHTLMIFQWFSSNHRKCGDCSFKHGKGVTIHVFGVCKR
jgi:hypothetical protein